MLSGTWACKRASGPCSERRLSVPEVHRSEVTLLGARTLARTTPIAVLMDGRAAVTELSGDARSRPAGTGHQTADHTS